ncbi:MAG: elongation factor P [bacterium]|nr:elongation factor P [bacterium]
MKATNIRKGHVIKREGVLYRVMAMDHITPGKGQAVVQTKLRNLIDGSQTEVRWRSSEDVEQATIETREMQYLYNDADGYHFMDLGSYEQIALAADLLGDAVRYLVPDLTLMMGWHDGSPVGVDLPAIVELKIVETSPSIKGATATKQRKPAKVETGLIVQVPPFIEEEEVIRVSTADGSYSGRVE